MRRTLIPRYALLTGLVVLVVLVLLLVMLRADPDEPRSLEPTFSDNFDGVLGNSPDRSKWGEWSGCTYNASAYYGDIKCGERATLDGEGHLRVPASPGVGTSISTGGRFSFVYGEASAWIKMPSEVGYWPAFWTLNGDPTGKIDSPNGEIDVLETYTTWPTIYHRTAHSWNGGDLNWSGREDPYCGNVNLSAEFHKYTVKVEPGSMTFYFDDKQCGSAVTKADGTGKPYQFGPDRTQGNWLLLTLAVGGADGQQEPASTSAVMLVDRVEVTGS